MPDRAGEGRLNQKNTVTPQVVDTFAFYSIKLNPRHPERSEGSPEAGMVFNSEMLRAKDGVPRVMTH